MAGPPTCSVGCSPAHLLTPRAVCSRPCSQRHKQAVAPVHGTCRGAEAPPELRALVRPWDTPSHPPGASSTASGSERPWLSLEPPAGRPARLCRARPATRPGPAPRRPRACPPAAARQSCTARARGLPRRPVLQPGGGAAGPLPQQHSGAAARAGGAGGPRTAPACPHGRHAPPPRVAAPARAAARPLAPSPSLAAPRSPAAPRRAPGGSPGAPGRRDLDPGAAGPQAAPRRGGGALRGVRPVLRKPDGNWGGTPTRKKMLC